MKNLLLLRHAKSDHADPGLADHDRPLNERGKRDAPRVGERLLAAGLVPDAILTSTAKRAKKTAEKVAAACNFEDPLRLVPELYCAGPATIAGVLAELDDVERAMIVGHNPGLQDFFAALTGDEREFPTAALAHIKLDVDSWQQVTAQSRGRLIALWRPRDEE